MEPDPFGIAVTPAPDLAIWGDQDWHLAEATAQRLFNPSSPIDEERLFSGRLDQVNDLLGVVYEKGAHAILYGERGVGKSSLANTITAKIPPAITNIRVLKENCRPEDTFFTLWSKILFSYELNGVAIPELLKDERRDFVVMKVLEELPKNSQFVFVFDEFDRISSVETKTAIADTIKHFSDYPKNITIVIVGVGHSIEELFGAHPSIQRCCRQIPLPRMSKHELREILTDRYPQIGIGCTDDIVDKLVDLSCGLPGFVHLAGRESALSAVRSRRDYIGEQDYDQAISESVRRAQESTITAYNKAIYSAKENIYKEVLLACAMARTDERGMFAAADIRDALIGILGRRVEIASFTRHLAAFCDPDRGPVLRKTGKKNRFQYQFVDAPLQPYIFLAARKSGLI
ncbi:AAA family ATPase [Bradyrhizobium sp. SZCCHNR1045]|uniref:nSTAND1 domain-containing NTPase n=1 Tax=Bradyrhizobium sp. SZCCHNR1045 TaxID=3057353 RepID=UPI0029162014|nr:AAA family ATPase [Bradyrhizobium sp. SZCCHNR1045]